MCDNKRFPDFEAVYQFVLKEAGETYYFYLSVSGGKADYSEGKHDANELIEKVNDAYLTIYAWKKLMTKKQILNMRKIREVFKKYYEGEVPEKLVGELYPLLDRAGYEGLVKVDHKASEIAKVEGEEKATSFVRGESSEYADFLNL